VNVGGPAVRECATRIKLVITIYQYIQLYMSRTVMGIRGAMLSRAKNKIFWKTMSKSAYFKKQIIYGAQLLFFILFFYITIKGI
jgi:hypothetical protein